MNEEHYILFDQYLTNELSAEERINFEKQLSDNPEMAEAFEIFKELNLHLDAKFGIANELNAFKQNVKAISKKNLKTKSAKVVTFRPWQYLAAASVAIMFGLFLFQTTNPSFEDYNEPENAYFTERGDVNANLKKAEEEFNKKNYREAIPYFEAVLKDNKSAEIQYFYAISLLEDNQIQKAETNLLQLKSGTSIYKEKAVWYLALSKLKQKEYESCKKILLTISDDFEDYDQVESLLQELD